MFTCNLGYLLSGDKELSCKPDFTWNGTEPSCQGKIFFSAFKLGDDVLLTLALAQSKVGPLWKKKALFGDFSKDFFYIIERVMVSGSCM